MPILNPQIQAALREVGLSKEKSQTISETLDDSGLTLEATIENLTDLAHAASNDSVRLRALETALKLRGILKEQTPPPPNITIVINDSEAKENNPILYPREMALPISKKVN